MPYIYGGRLRCYCVGGAGNSGAVDDYHRNAKATDGTFVGWNGEDRNEVLRKMGIDIDGGLPATQNSTGFNVNGIKGSDLGGCGGNRWGFYAKKCSAKCGC